MGPVGPQLPSKLLSPSLRMFDDLIAHLSGRPRHWLTPSLGKGGLIGSSRHNFAATPPFPDLSTPSDCLVFSGSDGALGAKIGAVGGREGQKNGM